MYVVRTMAECCPNHGQIAKAVPTRRPMGVADCGASLRPAFAAHALWPGGYHRARLSRDWDAVTGSIEVRRLRRCAERITGRTPGRSAMLNGLRSFRACRHRLAPPSVVLLAESAWACRASSGRPCHRNERRRRVATGKAAAIRGQ
jgi:hypothetical protein